MLSMYPLVVSFLLPCIVLLSTPVWSTNSSTIMEMMEDMGMTVPNECYTRPNLQDIFLRACGKVLHNDNTKCSTAWNAFTSAFGFEDPNNVTRDDYTDYFDVLKVFSPPNTVVFWSYVRPIIEVISRYPNISSSANQISSLIINTMIVDDNVQCWCGNETALLDTINPCPMTPGPTVAFWEKFSCLLGESASGIAFWVGDGDRNGGAYKDTSFFANYEFPKLILARVNRLVAIDIYDCDKNTGEKCGEGTLAELQNQAVEKYGSSTGYQCYEVCGDPFDEQQVSSLAAHTLNIIRKEQEGK